MPLGGLFLLMGINHRGVHRKLAPAPAQAPSISLHFLNPMPCAVSGACSSPAAYLGQMSKRVGGDSILGKVVFQPDLKGW